MLESKTAPTNRIAEKHQVDLSGKVIALENAASGDRKTAPAVSTLRDLVPGGLSTAHLNPRLLMKTNLGQLLAASLLLVSGAIHLAAQVPDFMPQRGVYPNGAYAFDKLETINEGNGILTYTIPITSLPLGRAGMTVPVNLVYSSALFDVQYTV
jgi:hypothetical protein